MKELLEVVLNKCYKYTKEGKVRDSCELGEEYEENI